MSTQNARDDDVDLVHVTQDDFLAQLAELIEIYDSGGRGWLTEEDWARVEADIAKKADQR